MSRNYTFHNPEGAYFVSFAVLLWSCIDHAKGFARQLGI